MYKTQKDNQITFYDFNQSCGIPLDQNNIWIQLAHRINWDEIEEKYRKHFPSNKGRPAVNSRVAIAALIIQIKKILVTEIL